MSIRTINKTLGSKAVGLAAICLAVVLTETLWPGLGTGAVKPLKVALVVGHTADSPGARSARGELERAFNKRMVRCIAAELKQNERIKVEIINDQPQIPLLDRAGAVGKTGAEVLLSIHHDSVQPQYLKTWTFEGAKEKYCDQFSGFSLFVSRKNGDFEKSTALAKLLGRTLFKSGLSPSLHHAEKIKGESRELLNPKYGIYYFDDLIILKRATVPAVLLECGVIANRAEEKILTSSQYRQRFARQVAKALNEYYVNVNLKGETDLKAGSSQKKDDSP